MSQSYKAILPLRKRHAISILARGVVSLLGSIKDEVMLKRYDFVEVFIDTDEKKIKFLFSRSAKPWSRRLSYKTLGQCTFNAANVISYAGCDLSKTKKIPVEWNDKENCIEFSYAEYVANEKTHQENEA